MTHRPFEAFCREHFVDSTGNVQNIKGNSKEARRRRNARKRHGLSFELRKLQRNLDTLYKKGIEARENEKSTPEVQALFREASKVRKGVEKIKKELNHLRK